MKLARIQAASGLVFSFFMLLHLATATSALAGIAEYDLVLETTRSWYRPNLLVEILLVGVPLAVHIACGVMSMRRRRRQGAGGSPAPRSLRVRIHRAAGFVLLLMIVPHFIPARVIPALVDPVKAGDFAYFAYSVMSWPVLIIAIYIVFVLAGALHFFLGVPHALKVLWPARIGTRRAMRVGVVVAAIGTVVIMSGLTAIFVRAPSASRELYPMYRAGYARYMPFMKGN